MPDLFVYLIKVNIALTFFYLGYRFGLRRLTFYTLNRYFLLLGILLSTVFPLLRLDDFSRAGGTLNGAVMYQVIDWNQVRRYAAPSQTPVLWQVLTVVFWLGVGVMTVRFLLQVLSLLRIHVKTTDAVLFSQPVKRMEGRLNPFSFLGHIYVNPALHSEAQLRDIIAHEQAHVRGWHSLDLLLAEINKIAYWFNPGVWLMKRAVAENLEFIADRRMLRAGADRKAYQYSLVSVSKLLPAAPMINHLQMVNQFNLSHLKKRILMMNKKRSSKVHLLRYLVGVPVIAAIVFAITVSKAGNRPAYLKRSFTAPLSASSTGRPGQVQAPRDSSPMVVTLSGNLAGRVDKGSLTVTGIKGVRVHDTSGHPFPADVLYIVDGQPRDSAFMWQLQPNTIESISVIHGESARSIYGPRAAHGVILIQTKPRHSLAPGSSFPPPPDSLPKSLTSAGATPHSFKEIVVVGYGSSQGTKRSGAAQTAVVRGKQAAQPADTANHTVYRFRSVSHQPLYVVDFNIVDSSYVATHLKPADIQQISVIKGVQAEKLFGEKGKDGAVLIKTKDSADLHSH